MKKIYRYTLILGALLLALPTLAQNTQTGPDPSDVKSNGLVVSKTVTQYPDKDGKYYIDIEAYATGKTTTTIVHTEKPVNAVLALDFSSSMVTDEFDRYTGLTRDYAYNNTTIEAPSKRNEKPDDWQKPYYYKVGDTYYEVELGYTEPDGQTKYNYYYQYDKDGVTYYLQPEDGTVSTNKPTSPTQDQNNGQVYTGTLYKKNIPTSSDEQGFYYVYYEGTNAQGQNKTYYWTQKYKKDNQPDQNGAFDWREKFENIPNSYTQAHDAPEDVIFTGQIYTKNGDEYTAYGNADAQYSYNDLKDGTYYIGFAPGANANYLFLQYTDNNGVTHYLTKDGNVVDTYPTDVTDKAKSVYKGTLYKDENATDGPDFYCAYVEKQEQQGIKTKYWLPDPNNATNYGWRDKYNEVSNDYVSSHQSSTESVIYTGVLYKGDNHTQVASTSYTYASLSTLLNSGDKYYVKEGKDYLEIKVWDPTPAESQTPDYVAVAQDEWKYDQYKDNYYYKDGDNYYLVTKGQQAAGMKYYQLKLFSPDASQSELEITWEPTTNDKWTYGMVNGKDKVFYYKETVNGVESYYQVSSIAEPAEGGALTAGYYLYFVDGDGTTQYLQGDAYSTTPYYVAGIGETIYSGELFGQTRLTALQAAMCKFIDIIAEKNAQIENADNRHQISIIPFEMDATVDNKYLRVEVNDENKQRLKDLILYKEAETGTNHPEALEAVYNEIKAINRGSNEVVIFFTDGETYDGNGTGNANQMAAGKKALPWANKIKDPTDGNADIYTVTLLTASKRNSFRWIDYLVRYISSWYSVNPEEFPKNYNTNTPWEAPYYEFLDSWLANDDGHGSVQARDQYFIQADADTDEGLDLTSIFEQLADVINTEGGTDITLTDKSLVAVDVMTSYFKLPEGTKASDITVYVQKSKITDGKLDFGDKVEVYPEDNSADISGVGVAVSGKEVDVYGFDYGANYCGIDNNNGTQTAHGYKLVFRIPIVIDPANPGGANLQTNEAISGIYQAKDNEIKIVDGVVEKGTKMSSFDKPMVNQPNIVILKRGLKAGHSATFLVEKMQDGTNTKDDNYESFYVTVTGREDASGNPVEVSAKVKLQNPGRYKVTETSWSWGYTPATDDKDNPWATEQRDKDSRVTFTASATNTTLGDHSACYIIRNVSHDTEEMIGTSTTLTEVDGTVVTHENLGTKFPFKNSFSTNLPSTRFSESYKVNKFYTPTGKQGNPGAGGTSGTATQLKGGETQADTEEFEIGGTTDEGGNETIGGE